MKKKLLILLIALVIFFPTIKVNAKTLGSLEKELNQKQQELNNNKNKKNQNSSEIRKSQAEINNTYSEMDNIKNEITNKTKESEELAEKIKKKKLQTKEIMRYYQVSSSGSAMLEYIMGAESLTDLIYRLSITEQISNYNNKMVKEMNDMIAKNEQIKKELVKKNEELKEKQSLLQDKIAKLNETQSALDEEGETINTYIKQMKSQIDYYKKLGCKSTDDLNACVNKYSSLPSGTTFYRPLTKGYITSNYGWRTLYGKPNNHLAVDIGGNSVGTPIFSTSEGRVAKVIYSSTGGGNQVIIHHYINGKYYTSYYCHLSTIKVSKNDVVTKDTIIGTVGSTGNSTGPHLHFGLATGRWYVDYYAYYGSAGFEGHSLNPRNVVIFPSGRGSWSNR